MTSPRDPEPPLHPPGAVLFDWDSTLVDNWGAIAHALNTALVAMGHAPWSEDEVRRRATASARDAFRRLFGDRDREALEIFYRELDSVHADAVRPLPGAAELLEVLGRHGVPMAVVSNKNGRHLRAEAERLGWTHHFVRLVGAADAEADKPDSAPVRMALAGTGVEPGPQVWFVGDSAVDLQCAHLARCVPILIQGGVTGLAGLDAWQPRHIFACRSDLQAAFLECVSGHAGRGC